jgi:FkbM family methyltransferase
MYVGSFPIYHKGEGTVHDATLVPDWDRIFNENSLTLARKYNPAWYQWKISNNAERGVFLKGDQVYPREAARYKFAAKNLNGVRRILEIGCSSGFGSQFLPDDIEYIGIDNDNEIIKVATAQNWKPNATFVAKDVNDILKDPEYGYFDAIIVYETLEHISNGLEVYEKLKSHCDKMFITVPYNESPGEFSPHHKLHNLTSDKFTGSIEVGLLDIEGNLIMHTEVAQANTEYNLVMYWDSKVKSRGNYRKDLAWLEEQHPEIYGEVINDNCYDIKPDDFATGMAVIDIGANIGSFSMLAAYMGAETVIAVEPIGDTYQQLTNNVKRSGLNITTKRNLVTDKKGVVHKISLNENSGHNSMYTVSERYEEVESTTLDDLLQESNSNNVLLKLDCEGAEYDIILNATNDQMSRVSRLVVEIHAELHPVYKGFEILENKLTSFGFKKYDLKQIYSWMIGPNGEMYDMKPIPYRIELWKK